MPAKILNSTPFKPVPAGFKIPDSGTIFLPGDPSDEEGIKKLELNKSAIDADLEDNWAVVAEGIQNILRREAYPNPYEALKALTRTNEKITQASMHDFINGLDVSDGIKAELMAITPFNHTGK